MAISYTSSQIQINSGKDSGTASSSTSTTLTCSSKAWTTNEYTEYVVWITGGTGVGQSRVIDSNTGTVLTLRKAWNTNPTSSSTFVIMYRMADVIAAVGTYASWQVSDSASRVVTLTAPIKLMSGGALSVHRETLNFTTITQTLLTASGSYFHAGDMASTVFPYNGTEGGSIISKATAAYWHIAWNGKMHIYGMTLDFKRTATDSTNAFAWINNPANSGVSTGVEMYSCILKGVVFSPQSADIIKNTNCLSHSTTTGPDAQYTIYGSATMSGNIGAFAPRADGSYTINGGDIIDHTSITSGSYEMFLYDFFIGTGQGIAYLWNAILSNAWSAIAYWYSDVGGDPFDTPTGKIYRGYTVDLTVKDFSGNAINTASVAVYDKNGDGGILTSKTATKEPTRTAAISTDSNGTYTGIVGTGNGLPILYAKYMASAPMSATSIETLYAPFTFKVRKYGYKFLQKSSNWTKKSSEDIALETNDYAIATEATVSAYTGISINGSTKTITMTSNHTLQEVYEYSQYWAAQIANMAYEEPITTVEGSNFTLTSGWTIIADTYLTFGTKRLSGGAIQYTSAGTYSPTTGEITFNFNASSGTFNLGGGNFSGTITLVNIGGGSITVSLSEGVSYVNSGPNITVDTPPVYQGISFTGLIAGSQVKVFTTTTQTVITSTTNSGTTFDWSDIYSVDKTIDYTIFKDGYIPIRVTGVLVSSSILTISIQQVVDNSFITPSGLTFGTTATVNTGTSRFTIGANTTGQNWYSFMVQSWRTEATLQNVAFPLITNGPNSVRLQNGWEFTSGLNYWTRDGLAYYNAGVLTKAYCAILTSGTTAGHQVKYIQSHNGTPVLASNTGVMDELVLIYGDATHGNIDYRSYLVMKIQADGYDQAEVDVVGTYGTLEDQLYVVGLVATSNGVTTSSTPRTITITDHGASPVTWEGKSWSITIDATGITGIQLMQWLKYSLSLNGTFQGKQTFYWHDLVRTDGSDFKTVRGYIYGDAGVTIKGVRVLDNSVAHSDFSIMTSDDGTTYVRPVPDIIQSFTVYGLTSGSLVQIYDVTNDTQLALGTSTTTYKWTDTVPAVSDRQIRIRVAYVSGATAKNFIEIANAGTCGTLSTNAEKDYTVSQEDDVVYNSNAIDGSTISGITINDALNSVEIAISGGTVTWQDIYAYEVYWLATEAGIIDDGAFITAVDVANYKLSGFTIKNTSSPVVPLVITNGYGVDYVSNESIDILDTTGGTIVLAPNHVVSSVVTVGGVNVITGDIADVSTEVQTGLTAQGYTSTRATKLDNLDVAVSTVGGGSAPTAIEIADEVMTRGLLEEDNFLALK